MTMMLVIAAQAQVEKQVRFAKATIPRHTKADCRAPSPPMMRMFFVLDAARHCRSS
jgi:hypothetical protein